MKKEKEEGEFPDIDLEISEWKKKFEQRLRHFNQERNSGKIRSTILTGETMISHERDAPERRPTLHSEERVPVSIDVQNTQTHREV